MKNEIKSVRVKHDLWKKLMKIKYEEGFSSLDDLITSLVKKYEK